MGHGWLSRGMGGCVEGWVAKLVWRRVPACYSRYLHWCKRKSNFPHIQYMYSIYSIQEIQNRAVAKSYTRKGFLINEEMRKYLTIYVEAVSHINNMTLQLLPTEFPYLWRKFDLSVWIIGIIHRRTTIILSQKTSPFYTQHYFQLACDPCIQRIKAL